MASREIRKIDIRIQSQGNAELKKIADGLGGLNKSVKKMSGDLGFLTNSFTGFFAALSVRELAGMSDEIQQLGDRIAVLSGSNEAAVSILEDLNSVAGRTKTSLANVATTYSRVAVSAKEAGLSSEQLIDLTEVLQNTFRLSGASTEEAAGATVQFSQALARGQLRGQELISVLSQNAFYANLLSDSLGVTRGKLLKMAEAGELSTNKVLTPLFENMDLVNQKASELSITFGQALTVSLNNFSLELYKINKQFGLSGVFFKGLTAMANNLEALGIIILSLASFKIPALIAQIKLLGIAVATANPIILALSVGLAGAAAAAVVAKDTYGDLSTALDVYTLKAREALAAADQNIFAKIFEQAGRNIPVLKDVLTLTRLIADASKTFIGDNLVTRNRDLLADRKRLDYTKDEGTPKPNFKESYEFNLLKAIKELNRLYDIGAITVAKYYESLRDLKSLQIEKDFAEGKSELSQYLLALNEIRKFDVYESFRRGALSLMEFNEAIEANQLEEINIKLKANIISLKEFDAQLVSISSKFDAGSAFRVGVEQYVSSIGTLNSQIANVFTNAFKQSEDLILEFNNTGKIAADTWREFGKTITDELLKITYRMYILKPLLEGLTGFVGGTATATQTYEPSGYAPGVNYNAKGGAFNNGVKFFAKGGIVSNPTMFSYGGNKLGMAGEAGSEAILPLSRGKGGELGVSASVAPVIVNINNNTSAEVVQNDRVGPNGERIIELLIQSKVKEALSNGSMDRTMKASYGLNRKGS